MAACSSLLRIATQAFEASATVAGRPMFSGLALVVPRVGNAQIANPPAVADASRSAGAHPSASPTGFCEFERGVMRNAGLLLIAHPLFPSPRLPSIAFLTSNFAWLKSATAPVSFAALAAFPPRDRVHGEFSEEQKLPSGERPGPNAGSSEDGRTSAGPR